jgi:RHS repeat-associated protein
MVRSTIHVPGPGVDEPVLWYQGAGTSTRSWLTADNQGSVIGYADQSGNSGATYTYGPYGEPITSSGASAWGGSRYRFTGQIEIPEAQLYFYKARMYDPAMGRFYQTDPAAYQSDVNLYAYATNDPINSFDPTGLGPSGIVITGSLGNGCYSTVDYEPLPATGTDDGGVSGGFEATAGQICFGGITPTTGPQGLGGRGGATEPQNKYGRCLSNVSSFINAHGADAATIGNQLGNGTTAAEVLATAGNETGWGGALAKYGNFFGLHGARPAGTYYTSSNHTPTQIFSGPDAFLSSGEVFVGNISPYLTAGMGQNPLAFFFISNQHGYATGNPSYPAAMVQNGSTRGPYTLVMACLAGAV